MKNLITLFLAVVVASSVSFGQTKEEKKKLKEEQKEQGFQDMKDLINAGAYEFTGEWATSQRGRRINLMTNPTYMKMDNQEADGFFPFFGERFSGSAGYGTDAGIEFKTKVTEHEVTYNDKKRQITIDFKAKGKHETFTVKMVVFSNGNSKVTIISNNRSIMNYDGKVKELTKKEDAN